MNRETPRGYTAACEVLQNAFGFQDDQRKAMDYLKKRWADFGGAVLQSNGGLTIQDRQAGYVTKAIAGATGAKFRENPPARRQRRNSHKRGRAYAVPAEPGWEDDEGYRLVTLFFDEVFGHTRDRQKAMKYFREHSDEFEEAGVVERCSGGGWKVDGERKDQLAAMVADGAGIVVEDRSSGAPPIGLVTPAGGRKELETLLRELFVAGEMHVSVGTAGGRVTEDAGEGGPLEGAVSKSKGVAYVEPDRVDDVVRAAKKYRPETDTYAAFVGGGDYDMRALKREIAKRRESRRIMEIAERDAALRAKRAQEAQKEAARKAKLNGGRAKAAPAGAATAEIKHGTPLDEAFRDAARDSSHGAAELGKYFWEHKNSFRGLVEFGKGEGKAWVVDGRDEDFIYHLRTGCSGSRQQAAPKAELLAPARTANGQKHGGPCELGRYIAEMMGAQHLHVGPKEALAMAAEEIKKGRNGWDEHVYRKDGSLLIYPGHESAVTLLVSKYRRR
jgi:hypothetical protein